jgi:poly-gamma-glutamate capsule biosynthesis protein CapA/YwtB (metallophosphatase superfamily)
VQSDDGMTVALAGLFCMQHRVSVFTETRFLQLAELIRGADVGIVDLLSTIQSGEDWPAYTAGASRSGTYVPAPPFTAEELRWFGFNVVLTASNHSSDFGESGILTNLRYLDAGNLAHAGTGASLTEASAPTYLDTANGRVAVICASDWGPRGLADLPFSMPQGVMAADGGPFFKARPGVNLLRFNAIHHVDQASMEALRRASRALGWEEAKAIRRAGGGRNAPIGDAIFGGEIDSDAEFFFMGTKFVLDDEFTFTTVPWQEDLERNYKWIREARRQADVVVVVLHQHGAERSPDDPAGHVRVFAKGAIDNGADIFARSSSSGPGGVEVYKGKPIIYGLTSFLLQPGQIGRVPPETMTRWGLLPGDTPADWLELREKAEGITVGHIRERGLARTAAIYIGAFDKSPRLRELRVIPLEMTEGSRAQFGRPLLADAASEISENTLDVIAERSAKFGTMLQVENGTGVVRLPDAS